MIVKPSFKALVDIYSNSIPAADTCHACSELIKSDTILAGPHHYHEQCFVCRHCGARLGDNFYCVNNNNYCLQHKEVGH